MGSFQSRPSSRPSPASSSTDGLNISSNSSSSKLRKSKRLKEKIRSRQSSKSDLIGQTTNAIDLIKSHAAQNPDGGENQNRDHDFTTADLGKICKQTSLPDGRSCNYTFFRPNNHKAERRFGAINGEQ